MKNNNDIRDDEIRVVGEVPKRNYRPMVFAVIAAVSVLLTLVLCLLVKGETDSHESVEGIYESEVVTEGDSIEVSAPRPYVKIEDVLVDNDSLRVYTPVYSKVYLSLGPYNFEDTTVAIVCQAADVRKDNLKILGDFVLNGEKMAFGHSKWGWCSITDNKIKMGCEKDPIALQDAIDMKGSFFRQFGLVLDGKYVKDTDNKKYRSFRRAICQKDGAIIIVESLSQISFYSFANLLVSFGVDNAVALVGSNTYGFAMDESGKKIEFGTLDSDWIFESTSYIVIR